MKLTGSRSVDQRKIVIFGAGKIGRSFIGQLFGTAGYSVVFIDVDNIVINLLNSRGSYRVVIKGDREEEIIVPVSEAISALDTERASDAIASAGILAVSVGKNALEKVIPVISAGLLRRRINFPGIPLDIILAENMRSAALFTREQLQKHFPDDFPIEDLVGLIETSIGKMVPIMPHAELEQDPLVVFAEPYNTLILDARGFKSPVPDVKGLAPKKNIKAWVDRKAFIHNLGHATSAYFGYSLHPGAVYMYEVLEDNEVLGFTRKVMLQSAEILKAEYPGEFTDDDLAEHIDDLIHRFRNKALRDTIFRVGMDLQRKLSSDDRFMGAIHLAMKHGKPFYLILAAMSYGLFFHAKDEAGNPYPSDTYFHELLKKDFRSAFKELLMIDYKADKAVIEALEKIYTESRVAGDSLIS